MGRGKKVRKQDFLQQESVSFLITLISAGIIFVFVGYLLGQYALQAIGTPRQSQSTPDQAALSNAINSQLDNLTLQNTAPASTPPASEGGFYKVQAGVFSQLANAEAMAEKLKKAGYGVVIGEGPPYRIQAGAFSSFDNARLLVEDLQAKGFEAVVIYP